MNDGGEAEMMDSTVGSLSPKSSCLDNIRDSNEIDASENGSRIWAEEPEIAIDLPSSTTLDVVLVKLADGKDLGPITPIPVDLSPSSDQTEDGDSASGCRTPTETIFDPFAPGPEDLMLAPKKKTMRETRVPLRRQLNFELCCDSDIEEEEEEETSLLESLCKSILDLILSNQLSRMPSENSLAESDSSEDFKTPTSSPFLSGIADSCPAAPMRPASSKSRRVGDSICRKLDFGCD